MVLGRIANTNVIDPFVWIDERLRAEPALLPRDAIGPGDAAAMMRPLVERDAVRTIDWVKTLPDAQQNVLLDGTLSAWASADPRAFLDWLSKQPAETLPKNMVSIERVASFEPERLGQWIASLPPGELRESSELRFATALAKQGRSAEALQHFPQNSTGDAVAQSAREFAATIAGQDVAMTAQGVRTLTAGGIQAAAEKGLVGFWASQSPQAAAQWMESLPAGAARDAATGSLASALVTVDSGVATAWLDQIIDPAQKNRATTEVFKGLARFNPASAREWLRAYPGADDALKNKLLRGQR